jgi:hypothetical protein
MPLNFLVREPCPKCGRPLMKAVIEAHPTDRTIAIHNLYCGDCGAVRTSVISLTPNKPTKESAASIPGNLGHPADPF